MKRGWAAVHHNRFSFHTRDKKLLAAAEPFPDTAPAPARIPAAPRALTGSGMLDRGRWAARRRSTSGRIEETATSGAGLGVGSRNDHLCI